MQRREFVTSGVCATLSAGAWLAGAESHAADAPSDEREPAEVNAGAGADAGGAIAVMADLVFPPASESQAAAALAALAIATRAEPGCRRYVVGRDVSRPGRFHLSELWDDLPALAAHFRTPHMAAFSSTARALGYAAENMQRLEIARISALDPRALARS